MIPVVEVTDTIFETPRVECLTRFGSEVGKECKHGIFGSGHGPCVVPILMWTVYAHLRIHLPTYLLTPFHSGLLPTKSQAPSSPVGVDPRPPSSNVPPPHLLHPYPGPFLYREWDVTGLRGLPPSPV